MRGSVNNKTLSLASRIYYLHTFPHNFLTPCPVLDGEIKFYRRLNRVPTASCKDHLFLPVERRILSARALQKEHMMELTIEQALYQGVSAHREGKLQDAERFYKAILQSQPTHPDANHNLGILAMSVGKTDIALTLFKTALDANREAEQF